MFSDGETTRPPGQLYDRTFLACHCASVTGSSVLGSLILKSGPINNDFIIIYIIYLYNLLLYYFF